jgi:hypothetical protein
MRDDNFSRTDTKYQYVQPLQRNLQASCCTCSTKKARKKRKLEILLARSLLSTITLNDLHSPSSQGLPFTNQLVERSKKKDSGEGRSRRSKVSLIAALLSFVLS